MQAVLSKRQQAEREFYDQRARLRDSDEVRFDPVLGPERRPWNSYWFVYEKAGECFARGARRLLDFGCGSGVVGIRLARLGFDVSGFDISPANIAQAQRRAARYDLAGRSRYSVQAAESLSYADESFEVVVGMDILHHVEIRPALREALRVLAPGGTAIFREHIEVPLLERMRRSRLGCRLVPPGESLERNVTRYERKLNREDLEIIRAICPDWTIHPFTLLSRLDILLRNADNPRPSLLERIDRRLFQFVPVLQPLAACAVLVLRKPAR